MRPIFNVFGIDSIICPLLAMILPLRTHSPTFLGHTVKKKHACRWKKARTEKEKTNQPTQQGKKKKKRSSVEGIVHMVSKYDDTQRELRFG